MASSPFFSVITPTYNRSKYIVKAIESVLAQTFQEFELIIVDDGSEDDTESLVVPFINTDSRVQYIKQENKGRSTARNVGIEAAKGEYICFLDSDDIWLPKHLQLIFDGTEKVSEPSFIFTALAYRFPNGEETQKRFPEIGQTKPIDYVIENQVSTITVAVHHSVLKQQRFNRELFINEDLELWARIVSELPIYYIDSVTAIAVQHDSNTTITAMDSISPQKKAMALVFNNPKLQSSFSSSFKKRKLRGLLELTIRSNEQRGERWALIKNLLTFLILYPTTSNNKSKIVTLIYTMPGGHLLKHIVQSSKQANR